MHLEGFMGGEVAVQGPLFHPELSGELRANRMSVRGNGLFMEFAEGNYFSGTYPEFDVTKVSCRMPRGEFMVKNKTFSVAHIEMDATKGRINLLAPSLHFPEIGLNSSF